MLIDGNSSDVTSEMLTSQVCIIGGGAAGIVLANELIDKYERVLLIDSGNVNYVQEAQELYKANSFSKPLPDPLYSRLRFLGGSTNHWQNNTSPLSPIDFEDRDWIKDSGWPISFSEVDQYYARAQQYCGVGSDGYDPSYWAKKFGKVDLFAESEVLTTGIAKSALAPTRFFAAHGEKIQLSDRVTILTNSNLTDVDFDGQKIKSVKLISNQGQEHTVTADKFVMALGGIENARMLLTFNSKYSDKLGNQSGNVGAYFMEHPTPRAAHLFIDNEATFDFYQMNNAQTKYVTPFISLSSKTLSEYSTCNVRMPLIPQDNYTISNGISSSHIIADALKKGDMPNDFGEHLYNVISDFDMVLEGIARKSFDTKLFDHADEIGGYESAIMMEQLPHKDNRIQLSPEKDRLGIPKIDIKYKVHQQDKDLFWRSLLLIGQETGALSLGRLKLLKERSTRIWESQLGFSNHHMGTTRMASSPEQGVVDQNCRVFGCDNFYVAGSSVFPTGGHVPPTLSIVALSIRLAEHLKHV